MFQHRLTLLLGSILLLSACGEGGTVNEGVPVCNGTSTGNVTISGTVSFQRVLHRTGLFVPPGLDYNNVRNDPARGVTVQILNSSSDAVLASTTTNNAGFYSLTSPNNTAVYIRVRAEMINSGAANWTVRVIDNTNGGALYAIDGNNACTTTSNEIRNIIATHGWTGSAYDNRTRVAGPFAILDTIYQGIQLVIGSQSTITFPALNINWSVNNSTASGNLTTGQIGTSFFRPSSNEIYILGAENDDTDEYDQHVIAHEWGHYLEANFSRSDSIGGFHTAGDRLDMRVAFGEGFGNAFSAMVLNDPVYRDSGATEQASGFDFNMESEPLVNPGWYSEQSVEQIMYDLYDNTPIEANDAINFGFTPIWNVLTNEQRTGLPLTSIFSFITALKADNPGDVANINTLVSAFNIVSSTMDAYGSTETNASTASPASNVLPVYTALAADGSTQNICVTDLFDRNQPSGNTLGIRRYLTFTIPGTGNYTFTASGSTGDPDIVLHQAGAITVFPVGQSGNVATETFNRAMTAGDYVLEFYDYELFTPVISSSRTRCFNLSITPI